MFSISNLTATEKSHIVLEKFNLSILEGNITAVIGRFKSDIDAIWSIFNESSTISIEGSIIFNGHTYSDRSFLTDEIRLVSYGDVLLPRFSVVENVFFSENQLFFGGYKKNRTEALIHLFDKFSINIKPWICAEELNRSEALIVELLRAYINHPKVCVLRDTLARLSDEYQPIAVNIIRSMQIEKGTSIIYLTTRYEDALNIAENLVVVSDGLTKGRFSVAEVVNDPKPLLYCISGWETESEENGSLRDMIGLLLEMHNSVESTSELKKALAFLVDSIKRVMLADSCSVLVTEEGLQTAIVVGDEQIVTQEILERVRQQKNDSQSACDVLLPQDTSRLTESEKLRHIFYVPIFLDEELAGLIVVGYETGQIGIQQKCKTLESFSREMAITIETSRLVGKSVLLQESHHRIKNNLQIITNLLFMQKVKFSGMNSEVQSAFEQIINQVKSIALIHDMLSKAKSGNSEINLRVIIQRIVQFYQNERLVFAVDVSDISIPYNKATTIALVINELITNCVKHAFANCENGRILIKCVSENGNLSIIVHDNGIGFSEGKAALGAGLGTNIVDTTVLKLGGEIVRSNNNGACVRITFSQDSIYE